MKLLPILNMVLVNVFVVVVVNDKVKLFFKKFKCPLKVNIFKFTSKEKIKKNLYSQVFITYLSILVKL